MPPVDHPTRAALLDYSLGRLPDERLDQIDSHLSECESCQDTLSGLELKADTLVEALRGAPVSDAGETSVAAPAGAAPRDTSGRLGPYRLLEKIGAGGMGDVYRAEHTKLGKQVALKLLPKRRVNSAERVARFEREMRAVGGLGDRHVVQAFDAGETDGQPYLAMELLDGEDLGRLVSNDGVMPVAEACEAIRQAALGLHHAHQSNLVHRDVKPSNLMLTTEGVVKVLDLGLAGFAEPGDHRNKPRPDASDTNDCATEPAGTPLTRNGQLLGTPDFMAPEQCDGDSDARTDVYALGASLYYLLTGRPPLPTRRYPTAAEKLKAIGSSRPPSITERRSDLPAPLARVIERLLAKDPMGRLQSAKEVASALAPFADGADLRRLVNDPAEPLGLARNGSGSRRPPRRWTVAAGAGTLGLAMLLTMTLRTASGTVVIDVPGDVAAELQVTLTNDGQTVVASDEAGWSVTIPPGEWTVRIDDPTDRFAISHDRVRVDNGEETTLTVKQREPEAAAVAVTTSPVDEPPPGGGQRRGDADPNEDEWDLRAELATGAYELNEHGAALFDGAAWRVVSERDASRGGTAGRNNRVTLTLVDTARDSVAATIAMTTPAAEALRTSLKKAIDGRSKTPGRAGGLGVSVGLYTKPYAVEPSGRVALPRRVRWRGLKEYRGYGPDGPIVDQRPTLILKDEEERFWPLIVKMPVTEARKLRGDLARAIRHRPPTKTTSLMLLTEGGLYVGARRGGGGEVTAVDREPGSSEVFAVEWTDPTRRAGRFKTRSGHFLHADLGGGGDVNATETEPKTSEVFRFEWLDDDRTRARLRTREGHYVRATNDAAGTVDARSTEPGPGTVFNLQPVRE